MKEDSIYIEHIKDAIKLIEKYTKEFNLKYFLEDRLVQDGVIRELEIIGEATKNLSDDFKKNLSDIEWRKIAGMRDKLIHQYFSVDPEEVWRTVERDIPFLKDKIENL